MTKAKFGVVVFPGSNCDHDAYNTLKHILKQDTEFLWHKESSVGDRNVIILPGGFSYGDYLRCGAIARFSGIMNDVVRFANNGGIVIGICNGFQVACEAGLLPGALLRNASLKFVCRNVTLKVENKNTIFTRSYDTGGSYVTDNIVLPVAHGDGNYICDEDTLKSLEDNKQVIFRYEDNPNGALDNIAGITNKKGNVLGMMPHPERASESVVGGSDGRYVFESIINSLN
jgi:phosphoribosylformylglycinamidine synthase subunit PurQ / glutaminase